MILSDLSQATPHSLSPIFNRFSRSALAKKLDVSTNYFCSVLSGYHPPSPRLENKMQTLSDQILEAEAKA